MVKLTIRMINGKKYNFEVPLDKQIIGIQKMIHDKMMDDYRKGENRADSLEKNRMPPSYNKIRLIYNKRELDIYETLHDIPEINESSDITMHMVFKRSEIYILIKFSADELWYNYNFHRPLHIETISEIKENIIPFILRNLDPPLRSDERIELKLYTREPRSELSDTKTLTEYGIRDGNDIECKIFRDGEEVITERYPDYIDDYAYGDIEANSRKYLVYKYDSIPERNRILEDIFFKKKYILYGGSKAPHPSLDKDALDLQASHVEPLAQKHLYLKYKNKYLNLKNIT